MFLYVFKEEEKQVLLDKGFLLLCVAKHSGKNIFVFEFNKKYNYENLNINYHVTNKLYF